LRWIVRRLAGERDAAERDSREKETRILSQSREVEELQNRLAEAERQNQQQHAELSELMSSKDDVGKNVRLLPFFHGSYGHGKSWNFLASHGKSWKMERVMEKSWNFNHLCSEKNS